MNAQTKIEPSLASAMAKAFAEIASATKTAPGQVGQQKYKYADLTAVIAAIKPALIEHGLFFTQHPMPSENGVTVETHLHHASGEHMTLGALFVPANKHDAQGYGSALTYARRYGLVTAFGVPVEDDDGSAASASAGKGQSKECAVSPSPPITDEQLEKLMLMLPAAKLTTQQFCQTFGIADVPELPAARFQEAINRINDRMAALAKAETDAKAQENA